MTIATDSARQVGAPFFQMLEQGGGSQPQELQTEISSYRVTAQQQYDATRRIARNDLKPGDLVFFERTYPSHERITHVGIYVGNGRMINAPTTGDVIREMDVFSGYWGPRFAGGGRVGA